MDELRQTMYAIAPHLAALVSFFPPMPQPFLNWVVARQGFIQRIHVTGKRFLHDQSNRTRLANHGGMFSREERRKLQAAE